MLKYLNINPTSSNNLTLRPTLLLGLNCCYKTLQANMGTTVPRNEVLRTIVLRRDLSFLGTKGLGYEKSVTRI